MEAFNVTVEASAEEPISSRLLELLSSKDCESVSDEGPATKKRRHTPKATWQTIPDEPGWAHPLQIAKAVIFVNFPTEGVSAEVLSSLDGREEPVSISSNAYLRPPRYNPHGFWMKYTEDGSALRVKIGCRRGGLNEMLVPCNPDDKIHAIIEATSRTAKFFPSKSRLRFLGAMRHERSDASHARFRIEIQVICKNAQSLTEASFESIDSMVLRLLFPSPPLLAQEAWQIRDLYENVHIPPTDGKLADEAAQLRVPGLECKLYPFQRRAVRWMLEREGVDTKGHRLDPVHTASESLTHGFVIAKDVNGDDIIVNEWLGIATANPSIVHEATKNCAGGLLAEEMGLGKTVEVISSLLLNQRPHDLIPDPLLGNLVPCRGSLIISPLSIQQQWKTEIEMHAPGLRVMIYEGLSGTKLNEEDIVADLVQYDVVLVSYNVLSKEIHYATEGPERSLRHEKQYRKRKSPLVLIDWWRCILDECQMIESGISQAAKVANEIPRRIAWAVSGTPLKKDANDFHGLLNFLRAEPYCYSNALWKRLITEYKPILNALIGDIVLRHSKDAVKAELILPPQTRLAITLPFTSVEEQHYTNLFQEMCEDCDLNLDGSPVVGGWRPEDYIERMRTWLSRLRQTVLHPEVGERNRKALGSSEGPLRTVAQVLKVMTEQNETAMRAEERNYLASKLRRGQILEHAKNTQEALKLWKSVLEQAERIVAECRKDQFLYAGIESKRLGTEQANGNEESEDDMVARAGAWRLRLRSSLEILHMATFFVANGHFQLKSNEEITKPGSEEFELLEQSETKLYDDAKFIRKEILTEPLTRANDLMNSIRGRPKINIRECKGPSVRGGIESRHVIERAEDLCETLNRQAEKLVEWREAIVKSLLLPLIDQEEAELQGDEYETSTKQQDEVYVYMEVLRAMEADRHDALTGQENVLIQHEMANNLRYAKSAKGHSPELMIRLLQERDALKPKQVLGSFRNIMSELRSLRTNLERKGGRSETEIQITDRVLHDLQQDFELQTKTMTELEKELDLFMSCSNARLAFYRQLQIISDSVAPFEEEFEEEARLRRLSEMRAAEAKTEAKITTLASRARYLEHLHQEEGAQREAKNCIICQDPISIGVLTSCGHQFCKECLKQWYHAHHTCPVCKTKLQKSSFHQISYKPAELSVLQEPSGNQSAMMDGADTSQQTVRTTLDDAVAHENSTTSIYSGISKQKFNEIANIDVPGASFGTKIDTLARHILYLRQSDPGAKSIIFSQFRDFLDILAKAFRRFKIAFVSVYDKQHGSRTHTSTMAKGATRGLSGAESGIERFKRDPSIEVFFLHAKAQAAGLNLVNATHVFLCEPLVNTALELQAIARVHRIGQHRPTCVYMYLVDGTVEQAIYDIGVQRRIEHAGQVQKSGTAGRSHGHDSKDRSVDVGDGSIVSDSVETSESIHLRESNVMRLLTSGRGGGELVPKDDVWACLFASRGAVRVPASPEAQRVVAGFLGADGAEKRMAERNRMGKDS